MPWPSLIILIALFLITSAVGVVTGSNSLITVPVMFQFGIDEKVAVATNMFGLTFMSIGASIPFVWNRAFDVRRTAPLVVVTLFGSAAGALLIGILTNQSVKLIVSTAMIAVALFTLLSGNRERGENGAIRSGRNSTLITYIFTLILAVYGGLYSGGYVTMLTAVYVAFFGMSFTESVAATKFINVFSSLIATLIFMWQGLVDYRLGVILAAAMFTGAYAGAHFVTKISEKWIRRIFLAAVFVLAIKLIIDLAGQ